MDKLTKMVEQKKIPKHLKGVIKESLKHARRKGMDVSQIDDGFFED